MIVESTDERKGNGMAGRLLRRARRGSGWRLGATISILVLGGIVPALAHDTTYCKHVDGGGGGPPSSWEITYQSDEWVGGSHFHYYKHWTQSGTFLHNETNICNNAH